MNIKRILHKTVEIIDIIESIMMALEQFEKFDTTVAMEILKENRELDDEERIIRGLVTLIVGNLGEKTGLDKKEVDFVMRMALKAGCAVRKTAKNRTTQ